VTFEEFISNRLNALLRYATVISCDPHLAEDITQDVLIRVQSRWTRIRDLDAPEPYVKRMLLNEFLSWRRRKAARQVPLAREALEPFMPPAPDPTGGRDERDAVVSLIARLPPKQRAAVALRYYEDLTDQQIAELLGCRTATVRSHISHALATLRDTLPTMLAPTTRSLS
jgi:RNA polymerase sigma-70 factor (sigma-E family)